MVGICFMNKAKISNGVVEGSLIVSEQQHVVGIRHILLVELICAKHW
jgi:hypothetical protein